MPSKSATRWTSPSFLQSKVGAAKVEGRGGQLLHTLSQESNLVVSDLALCFVSSFS